MTALAGNSGRRLLLPGRRRTWAAYVSVIAVLTVAVVSDRIARAAVENRIAARASCALNAHNASASLQSTTTLPHLVTGDLGTVKLQAPHAAPRGIPVNIAATLNGVHTDGHIDASTETITVPFASALQQSSGGLATGAGHMTLTGIDGNGRYLLIHANLPQLPAPITLAAKVTAAGRDLTITPVNLDVMGHSVPVAQIKPLLAARDPAAAAQLAPRHVPLRQLPPSVRLDSVSPQPTGLALHTHTGPMSGASATDGRCT